MEVPVSVSAVSFRRSADLVARSIFNPEEEVLHGAGTDARYDERPLLARNAVPMSSDRERLPAQLERAERDDGTVVPGITLGVVRTALRRRSRRDGIGVAARGEEDQDRDSEKQAAHGIP